jgi:hypothetical protein
MLFACPALFAQGADSPRKLLDDCIATLDRTVLGLEEIEAECPGLESALEQLGLGDFLPTRQHSLLSRNGLINLRSLLDRYEQTPQLEEIATDRVQAVLESLREPARAEQSEGWLQRFRRWLRRMFGRQDEVASEPSWLSRWLREHSLSEAVWRGLLYVAMALVLILAIVIVVNEIRAARVGRRKSRTDGGAGSAREALAIPPWQDESRGARASALLRSLIDTLVKTGRLEGAQNLTHRELMARARLDDPAQRESFLRVTQFAERELFSGKEIPREDLDEVVRAGERLNAQLSGAAT